MLQITEGRNFLSRDFSFLYFCNLFHRASIHWPFSYDHSQIKVSLPEIKQGQFAWQQFFLNFNFPHRIDLSLLENDREMCKSSRSCTSSWNSLLPCYLTDKIAHWLHSGFVSCHSFRNVKNVDATGEKQKQVLKSGFPCGLLQLDEGTQT